MLDLSPMITGYILVVASLLGAVFANFLSCMGWRMSKGDSVLKGRSHCDSCGHVLSVRDLIPILSYIARKGRCAYCGAKIPKSSLYGELLLGFLFVFTTLRFDVTLELVLMLVFVCILYLISVIDMQVQIIPDGCLLVAVIARVIYYFCTESFQLGSFLALLGNGLSISLPLLILVLVMEKILKKEAMGGGDIKLLFVTGMYLGWEKNLLALFFACIVGIIYGAVRMRSEKELGAFPFGPFIAAGTIVSILVGDIWFLAVW